MRVDQAPHISGPRATHVADRSVVRLGRACLTAFDSSWVTVIAVRGQVDSCNAALAGSWLHQFVNPQRALVLDFSELEFLGCEGLEALFALGDRCDSLSVDWALVTSHPVRRLLNVADSERRLPAVGSMVEVLQRFRTATRMRRDLRVSD